jgi:hypothetical protein
MAIYMLGFALFSGSAALAVLAVLVAVYFLGLALLWLWRGAIVEIEQGTTQENVPLKAIEYFLKFRIEAPLAFVRVIGASNVDRGRLDSEESR